MERLSWQILRATPAERSALTRAMIFRKMSWSKGRWSSGTLHDVTSMRMFLQDSSVGVAIKAGEVPFEPEVMEDVPRNVGHHAT